MAQEAGPPEAIREQSVEVLLRAFAALTHKIHVSREEPEREEDLRSQRDIIKREIQRRCGEL